MGYRRRKRRFSHPRPARRRREEDDSLVGVLAELTLLGIAAAVRGLVQVVRWLWGWAMERRRAAKAAVMVETPAVMVETPAVQQAVVSAALGETSRPAQVTGEAGSSKGKPRVAEVRWAGPPGALVAQEAGAMKEEPPVVGVGWREPEALGVSWAGGKERLPYRRAPYLLSKGERAFWYPLYQAVRGQYRLFCKVRLQDVVSAPAELRDEQRWFGKIRGYHVDFVVCEPRTTAPLLVVELDDRSHGSAIRRGRDEFKNAVLAAAGLPVYRVPVQEAYDPSELGATIRRMIGEGGRG